MIQRLLITALLTALLVVPTSYANSLNAFRKVTDFYLEVAKGNVPGHTIMEKFGVHDDLLTASDFEVIWDEGLIYIPPTEARLHNIVAGLAADAGTLVSGPSTITGGSFTNLRDSSADFVTDSVAVGDAVLNDTNVMIGFVTAITNLNQLVIGGGMVNPSSGLRKPTAGARNLSIFAKKNAVGDSYRIVRDASTGVSILHILGHSAARLEITEFVLLNGVSIVATSKSYVRQYRGRLFATASSGAASNISSTAQVDGTVSMNVRTPNNQTEMTPYSVPIDKTGYILAWRLGLSKKQSSTSNVHLKAGTIDGVGYIVDEAAVNSLGSSHYPYTYVVPIPVPGGSDIWLEADTDTNNVGAAGGFTILLVDN